MYIATSMIVLYSSGEGVVPKGKRSKREAILYTIGIQVNAVVSFAYIWR